MYLLIPVHLLPYQTLQSFTSHYVSINSKTGCGYVRLEQNLHPTMYLLILSELSKETNLSVNLHPTMYLLIPDADAFVALALAIYIPLCIY